MKQDQFLFVELCPLCGSQDFAHYLTTADHFLTAKEFDLEKCNACGFVFTNPIVQSDHIGAYYASEKYYSHPQKKHSIVAMIYGLFKRRNISSKYKLIHQFKQAGKILDIGCGSGEFLRYGKQKGWEVHGIEPNASAREYAAKLTETTILKPEQSDQLPDSYFDVVTMWHVLEHIMNLEEQLMIIRKTISKDACVFVALPNHKSHDAFKYGTYWAAWDVPRHLYHFDKDTINYLFSKNGFELKGIYPMVWDAFYVSMLSEKYMGNKFPYMRAIISGIESNRQAATDNNYSSLVYCFKQKKT